MYNYKLIIRSHISRYIIAGTATTLVNFTAFYLLYALLHIDVDISNSISVICAVIFAYVVNKVFVFRTPFHSIKILGLEFLAFLVSRLTTMIIEIAGVYLGHSLLDINAMISKIIINIVVLILNYIFSKYFVFTKKD
ncbi:MAG: GtrA family protein [Methanomassiliicoccales archaeon]